MSYEQTGGHPALLRGLGSSAHRREPNRRAASSIAEGNVRALAQDFLIERSSLLDQLVSTLRDEYPDEYFLLTLLAEGKVNEFADWARSSPPDVAHLVGYGICKDPHTVPRLRISLLQTYLQRQLDAIGKPSISHTSDDLQAGQDVGDYVIEHTVGAQGGFARVYKAHRQDKPSEVAALKVVRNGKLSSVQRELDILQTLNHQNIVKILDAGSLANGDAYLVMEYIEGPTLRTCCEASTRPPEPTLLKWAVALLGALERMHPRPLQVDDMRKRHDELDGDVAQAIFEAQHGVVHRDIKPANIILNKARGPVLIDFNISVTAGTPIKTVSATPHYLPPGMLISNWTHEVDIYQLGLTLLQLAAGAEIGRATLEDLKTLAQSNMSPRTFKIICKMLDYQGSTGYRLTADAHRETRTALNAVGRG
jgi:serine/threonine protein kinase